MLASNGYAWSFITARLQLYTFTMPAEIEMSRPASWYQSTVILILVHYTPPPPPQGIQYAWSQLCTHGFIKQLLDKGAKLLRL